MAATIIDKLNHLLQDEIVGMHMYLHYSFIVSGPNMIPLKQYLTAQAADGLRHATLIGDKIASLGGAPVTKALDEEFPTSFENAKQMLAACLKFEKEGIGEYTSLLQEVLNKDIALEMFLKTIIADEIHHVEELEKMLKEF